MKDSFYFPHDYNARNDQKILELRSEFGWEGYGIFWALIETMAEASDDSIDRGAIGGLSVGYSHPKGEIIKIIDFCIKIGLFEEKNGFIFSSRMTEQKNIRRELSEAGKRGAEKRWKNGGAISHPISHPNAKERKGKERKERKEKERKENIYTPEAEKILKITEEVFGHKKILTNESKRKLKTRLGTYTIEQLVSAFQNLKNEPDQWKINNNGHRPLAWWLHSDERIEDMLNCHRKKTSKEDDNKPIFENNL